VTYFCLLKATIYRLREERPTKRSAAEESSASSTSCLPAFFLAANATDHFLWFILWACFMGKVTVTFKLKFKVKLRVLVSLHGRTAELPLSIYLLLMLLPQRLCRERRHRYCQ
jgi:hypothetical protein